MMKKQPQMIIHDEEDLLTNDLQKMLPKVLNTFFPIIFENKSRGIRLKFDVDELTMTLTQEKIKKGKK